MAFSDIVAGLIKAGLYRDRRGDDPRSTPLPASGQPGKAPGGENPLTRPDPATPEARTRKQPLT